MNPYDAAFPRMSHTNCHGLRLEEQDGMTLRDYFVAKAMQGIVANSNTKKIEKPELRFYANFSYAMADAMLKAREQ